MSNLEFRYQNIVSSIKLRKVLRCLCMIQIVLKFLSLQFIASVEVSNMARSSSKTNELRDTASKGCKARNITI